MKYFYDTEFIENGRTITLISIGIVADDGREYYAVNAEMPIERIKKKDWLVRNVMPSLPVTGRTSLEKYLAHPENLYPKPSLYSVGIDRAATEVKPRRVIANEVRDFLTAAGPGVELWAYFAAYDHVALSQLYGSMTALPKGFPMYTHELMQAWEDAGRPVMPPQLEERQHNALEDARWNAKLYAALER